MFLIDSGLEPSAVHSGFFKGAPQGFGLPVMAVDHGNVVQALAVGVPFTDAAGDVVCFIVETVESSELRLWPVCAGHFRRNQWDVVVVSVMGLQEVLGEVIGETKDFAGVAVVEPQDSGASTGLYAGAG